MNYITITSIHLYPFIRTYIQPLSSLAFITPTILRERSEKKGVKCPEVPPNLSQPMHVCIHANLEYLYLPLPSLFFHLDWLLCNLPTSIPSSPISSPSSPPTRSLPLPLTTPLPLSLMPFSHSIPTQPIPPLPTFIATSNKSPTLSIRLGSAWTT